MDMFGKWQHALARRAVRKHFAAVRCAGLSNLHTLGPEQPILLCPVHTSWWDGFLAACLMPRLPGREFRLAQEDLHLRRYPWFRHAGVIGIDATNPGRLRAGLRKLAAALRQPRTLMVYFPQGVLTLQDSQPIVVRRGIGWLAEASGVPVVPVYWRHGFRDGARPEVWMRVGAPLHGAGNALTDALQSALRELETSAAADWALGRDTDYEPLWQPARPVNEAWWRWRRRFSRSGDSPPSAGR